MNVVAGVDSSTQSCTVVFRSCEDGSTVAVVRSDHPPTNPPVSEQHPDAWWSALRDALSRAGVAADDVAGVTVTAQAHGLVPLDGTGAVIRPAKLWNDTTSVPEARTLVERLGPSEWVRRAGSVPPGAFTIGKVYWLARHEPERFARLRMILLPHDWLTYRLVGRYVTDPGDASGTGYFNPAAGQWDTGLLGLIDGSVDWAQRLPQILRYDEPAGTLTAAAAADLGLRAGTVVGAGTADNQAAAVGMGLRVGDVVVSLGTSGVVYARATAPIRDVTGAVNGNADAMGGYLPVFCTLNAAKVTDTFARLLGVGHDELTRLALAAPAVDPDRPVLAGYLDGERVPDRPAATGTLTGLRTDTTREQVARAAYEGVLAGLVRGIETFRDLDIPVDGRLAVTGGGARSMAYCQLLADLTGRPVHTVDQAETAAAGAAIQSAAAVFGTDIAELAQQWAPRWQVVADPRPGTDPDRLLERYRRLCCWDGMESDPGPIAPRNQEIDR